MQWNQFDESKKTGMCPKTGISINRESASSYFISGYVGAYQIFQHEMLYQVHLNFLNARTQKNPVNFGV